MLEESVMKHEYKCGIQIRQYMDMPIGQGHDTARIHQRNIFAYICAICAYVYMSLCMYVFINYTHTYIHLHDTYVYA